jgi:hypothetical protein
VRACACVAAVLFVLAVVPSAQAYDTGPHADITVDALRSEGFGQPAADVARVNNWFIDLYSQAKITPQSGHADTLETVLGLGPIGLLKRIVRREHWSQAVIDAAHLSHFDPVERLGNTAGIEGEWDRLRRTTYLAALDARARNDPLQLLTAIGISLHQLQDFYSHSNWVEVRPPNGGEGPEWEAQGQGRTPTWFDVPKRVRDQSRVYVGGLPGGRGHGNWKGNGSGGLDRAVAKDWPGRLFYDRAHLASYFASRQWVRAIRTWVGDDAFWARAQRYAQQLAQLRHDVKGSFRVSLYAGRWQGQGGPCTPLCGETSGQGGSLVSLRSSVNSFFDRRPTLFRRTFEKVVPLIANPRPPLDLELGRMRVVSSRDLQAATAFVRLRVVHLTGNDLGDPGPDDADMYARATIAGQRYDSAVIHSRDQFAFEQPYEPFTWLKAVPRGGTYSRPVSSITIEVRTSNSRGAGTDDDVSLRLGPNLRFPLDKRLYDDFERGDRDTYSVPIDAATRRGLTVGDIRFLEIAKSRDGIGGGWKLGGLKLEVNGSPVYSDGRIERTLEDNRRTFRARNFTPPRRTGPLLPVWLDLREDDDIFGGDDQGDVNPFDARNAAATGYAPGQQKVRKLAEGGHRLRGRLGKGGDKATLIYELNTIFPVLSTLAPPPPPPPSTLGKPDLVISSHDAVANQFTITNRGTAAAGRFSVKVTTLNSFEFDDGLAPGESATRTYASGCRAGTHEVRADSLFEVDESNESNNVATTDVIC